MTDRIALVARNVTRTYGRTSRTQQVLAVVDVSITVPTGEVVAIMGPSGSGKSTLGFLLAGLDTPDHGSVELGGIGWACVPARGRAQFRRRHCGFIPQGFSLLPQATVAENVEVPLLLDGIADDSRDRRVAVALDRVDLAAHSAKLPDQLSGGQRQRVAVARALIAQPRVVIADEPTANLDSANALAVTRLLLECAKADTTAVVLITHDPAVSALADRILTMHSGRLSTPT